MMKRPGRTTRRVVVSGTYFVVLSWFVVPFPLCTIIKLIKSQEGGGWLGGECTDTMHGRSRGCTHTMHGRSRGCTDTMHGRSRVAI